jgi:hypothetical protein
LPFPEASFTRGYRHRNREAGTRFIRAGRATLAANLLESLPGILSDEDEGVAEALRRDAEMVADPNQAISLEQLDSHIQGRRS